jgi:uncharacterized protein YndB with AHSA1/START domain
VTAGFHNEVVIAAPPEKVFDALTTLEGLAGWWTPVVAGSATPGGEVTFGFGDQRIVMRVDVVVPAQQVSWTCLGHSKFSEWDGTRLSFELHPQNGLTVLAFEHAGLVSDLVCYPDCSVGWAHYLHSLAAYAATGRGMPWRTPGWRPARASSDTVPPGHRSGLPVG